MAKTPMAAGDEADVRQCDDAIHDGQFDLIGHRQDGDEAEDVEPDGNALLLFLFQWINVAGRLEIVAGPDSCKQFGFRMQCRQFRFI